MTILAKMPPGLAVGMRIKTNELYLKINRRCQPREGTIIAPVPQSAVVWFILMVINPPMRWTQNFSMSSGVEHERRGI